MADLATSTCIALSWRPDGSTPERSDFRLVLLVERLRQAGATLNPNVPQAARELAIRQIIVSAVAGVVGRGVGLSGDIMTAMSAKPSSSAALFGWLWRKPSA